MASTVTSPRRLPSDPPQPDLSHLTEEERQIIESVLERQKVEAERDQHMISNLEKDVKRLEANIKKQIEQAGDLSGAMNSAADGDTCRICNKVKFAGGAGYTCHYCQLKSCSRCGGKLALKSKAIWACNLCRKKQELALKTGQWYHGMKPSGLERKGSLVRQSSISSDTENTSSRRSRDMRIGGAAKRSSSAHALMETDQMDENGNHSRMYLRKSNCDMSRPVRLRGEMETTNFIIPKAKPSVTKHSPMETKSPSGGQFSGPRQSFSHNEEIPSVHTNHMPVRANKSTPVELYENRGQHSPGGLSTDTNRGGQWLTPTSSEKLHPGSSDTSSTIRERASSTSSRRSDCSRRSMAGRTYATSEADINRDHYAQQPPSRSQHSRQHSSSECLSDITHSSMRHGQRPDPPPRRNIPEPAARQSRAPPADDQRLERTRMSDMEVRSATGNVPETNRERQGTSYAGSADSYTRQQHPTEQPRRSSPMIDRSSPMIDCSRPMIDRKATNIDKRPEAKLEDTKEKNSSQESSSTNASNKLTVPGIMKREEQLAEGENVKTARSRRREMAMVHADSLSSDPSDCVRPPPPKPHKHRKSRNSDTCKQHPSGPVKTGDFSSSEDEMRSTTSCGDDLESESVISEKAPSTNSSRYEGVSSNAINAKIKNFLAHPVEWHVSPDHRYIEGHMMLSRHLTTDGKPTDGAVLGLRVVGGKVNKEGRLGAFITNVKPGSIADVIGHLQRDDEVIEWNGRSLRDVTNDEASDIITEARHEPLVELIVQRPYSKDHLPPQMVSEDDSRDFRERHWNEGPPSVTVTAPDSPTIARRLMSITHVSGKIQLKVSYDAQGEELIILVLSASELPLVDGNQPPQAYCQVCLLPDDNEASKRMTRPVARTREPEWKQSFAYHPISGLDFETTSIEVTVWNLKKNGRSEFLGEIVIDLASTKLSSDPLWYRLRHHDATSAPFTNHKQTHSGRVNTGGTERDRSDGRFKTGRAITPPHMDDMNDDVDNTLDPLKDLLAHHQPVDKDRYGSQRTRSNHSPIQQVQNRGGRQPSRSVHSSREDLGAPSPVPSRRQHFQNAPSFSGRGQRGNDMQFSQRKSPHYAAYNHAEDDRYRDGNRSRSSDTYYSNNRMSPDEDMFPSDASEISGFSMQSTQSERPNRSNKKLSEFASHMESRGAGRRPGAPQGMPPRSRDHYDNGGSMSDSGLPTDRRMNRMKMGNREYHGSNQQINDAHDRHRMMRPDANSLHDRRSMRMRKQTSKDSTDGSVCSVSSDSSNTKQMFAHISNRIEGLKRNSPSDDSISGPNIHIHGVPTSYDMGYDTINSRRDSEFSTLSDMRLGSEALLDFRCGSDMSLSLERRPSCASLESSLYEDDLARAQMMSDHGFMSPRQHEMHMNTVERLNEIGAYRRADPRKGLPVNEIVAAISHAANRDQHGSAYSVTAPPTTHNSNTHAYQDSGYQSSASNHSSASHQRPPQFPYGSRPDVPGAFLKDPSRRSLGPLGAVGDPALPWAQPRNGNDGLTDFINDLGKGQIVGRQVLGTSCIGWIQMGLSDKKGRLEVEIIRAKDLHIKSGAKNPPSTYAKAYLMDGKTCVEKMKTSHSDRNTTEPFFKSILTFMEPYMQKMLHVMIWGDYGRINEKKVFMGVCQVNLDDLDLSKIVFGWYKLFNIQAMAGPGSYRRNSQTSSAESSSYNSPRYTK